ncbi:MAG: ATP-dependent DNA helicase, partial [Gammaproteobacteria bacterium]|nr:ATP-dependent DNA helicase [Gammaproteobacteria bacterium]
VVETIEQGGVLVTEAGTGVGKTFAYLVPAMLSGKRVIIATGTKNLQDQLFHEDIPLVREALAVPVTVALLKGRANYLCTHRLNMNLAAGDSSSRRHQHELEVILDWAGRTSTGDIAEVDDVEEGSFVWPLVTSSTENCIGQDCDDYSDCYVIKARREAQAADIVVINHHLFFADMALKEQGFGDILPGADVFIIDEAHQLPEVAGSFFATSVTSRQLYNLVTDTQTEHLKESGGLSELPEALHKLERSVADLRLCMGHTGQRLSWDDLQSLKNFHDFLEVVKKNLSALRDWLSDAAERGKGLDSCHKRALTLLERINMMNASPTEDENEMILDNVRWADTSRRGFGLHSTPLNIAEIFQTNMQAMMASWVFTSATLAVGESFAHFNDSLGLDEPDTQLLGSPFDYKNNGLKYLPEALPDPADASYTREVCAQSLRVIEAAQGRTFMLFTSHRALKIAAEFMADHINYPILVQGEAPKQRLLKDFKTHGNAVLLGTASFWEGVDVRGSALSCVIIDKLPFASPGDPVMQARLISMKKRGQNPFFDYQVPSAVVTLKQGVGRLIRDINDCGVLMLCDPRLLGKAYGKIFLRSLPAMPLTRNIEDVERFFEIRKSA